MALRVQKFGGTSVADITHIRNVAKRVIETYDGGDNIVVVLSAMAGVTNNLISMAKEASKAPDKRELDVLLATGEQTTAAVLAIILKSMGYKSISLLGFQAGILTDTTPGKARIVDIETKRMEKLLEDRHIL